MAKVRAAGTSSDEPVAIPFKWVFGTTVGLTVFTLILGVALTQWGREGKGTEKGIDICFTLTQMGAGAIFGLMGGKSLK